MTTAAWRVLIVEPDEIRMRHYMLELMQDSAFHLAATAPNKRRAMPLIDRTPVDLAVVNARLPDGCGAEITRAVLKKNPDAHILIATDVSEENTVMQSVEAGADGYILVTNDAPRIADSLKVMAAGGSPVSPLIARSVCAPCTHETPRRLRPQATSSRAGSLTSWGSSLRASR